MKDDMFQILSEEICLEAAEDGLIRALFVPPADFPPFNGHFPGNPILPGVAQISLVTGVLKKAFNQEFVLSTVKRIKFMAPATPGMLLSISIKFDNGNVNADITSGENRISNLKLIYEYGESL